MERELDHWVREAVDTLVAFCSPERIILYGSHAKGSAGPCSDIDLIVVCSMQGSRLERRAALRQLFATWPIRVDASAFTAEELECAAGESHTFIRAAVQGGREVYRREHTHPRTRQPTGGSE
jgi:predicted nucleotidyltransferase